MLWNGALRPLAREIKGSGLKPGAVYCTYSDEMSSFRLESRGFESCVRKGGEKEI